MSSPTTSVSMWLIISRWDITCSHSKSACDVLTIRVQKDYFPEDTSRLKYDLPWPIIICKWRWMLSKEEEREAHIEHIIRYQSHSMSKWYQCISIKFLVCDPISHHVTLHRTTITEFLMAPYAAGIIKAAVVVLLNWTQTLRLIVGLTPVLIPANRKIKFMQWCQQSVQILIVGSGGECTFCHFSCKSGHINPSIRLSSNVEWIVQKLREHLEPLFPVEQII